MRAFILTVMVICFTEILPAKPTDPKGTKLSEGRPELLPAPSTPKETTWLPATQVGQIVTMNLGHIYIRSKDEGFDVEIKIDKTITNGMLVAVMVAPMEFSGKKCLSIMIQPCPQEAIYMATNNSTYRLRNLPSISMGHIILVDKDLYGEVCVTPRPNHEEEDFVVWIPSRKHVDILDHVSYTVDSAIFNVSKRSRVNDSPGIRIRVNKIEQPFQKEKGDDVPSEESSPK